MDLNKGTKATTETQTDNIWLYNMNLLMKLIVWIVIVINTATLHDSLELSSIEPPTFWEMDHYFHCMLIALCNL